VAVQVHVHADFAAPAQGQEPEVFIAWIHGGAG